MEQTEDDDFSFIGIQRDGFPRDGVQREGGSSFADLKESCSKQEMCSEHREQHGANDDGKTFHKDLQHAMSNEECGISSSYPTMQFFSGATAAGQRWAVRFFSAGAFKEAELELFGPREGDGVSLGEARIAVVVGNTGGGL